MMLVMNPFFFSRSKCDTQTAPLTMRGGWVYSIGLISDEKNGD